MTTETGNNTQDDVVYCARHPQVETVLRCGRCNTPICPRCLVQTPVGARCRECANLRAIPTLDVKPIFLVRGAIGAIVGGAFAGAVWGFTLGDRLVFAIYISIIIAFVVGWAVAESIGVATNRKRGPALQACAVLGCVIAYVVHNLVAGDTLLPQGDVWGYLAAGGAAFFAASRLRY